MKISVIVPAYNEEKLLGNLLTALGQQTHEPDEIIIVDNNSTDHTAAIARSYGVSVVRCVRAGVGSARQAGLEAATGDVVLTTDADCLPQSTWVKYMAEALQDAIAVYGPLRFYGVPEADAWFSEYGYKAFLQVSRMAGRPNLAGSNMGFHRTPALEVGGYPLSYTREDVILGYKLMRRGGVRYVPEALMHTSGRRLQDGWSRLLFKNFSDLFNKNPKAYR